MSVTSKFMVHHTKTLTMVTMSDTREAFCLNRLEAADLRQKLVPPEAKERREVGVGDNRQHERLWGIKAGHVLTEQDAADLREMLTEYNDQITDLSNAHHDGRLAAFREIGGDALVAAAETASNAEIDMLVDHAMRKFSEAAARFDAKKAAGESPAVDAAATKPQA